MAQSDNNAEKYQHPVKEQVYLRASSRLAPEFDRTRKLAKERMALAKDGLDGKAWTEHSGKQRSSSTISGLRVPDFPSTTSETDSDYKSVRSVALRPLATRLYRTLRENLFIGDRDNLTLEVIHV